jgi:hypothetical protein
MTTAQDEHGTPAGSTPAARGRDPRRVVRVLAAAVTVLVLAGASWWVAYDTHYQPLESGGSGGPRASAVRVTDGIGATAYLVTGAKGTRAVIQYSLHNAGRFPVRVLGLLTDEAFNNMSMRWAPELTDGGAVGGTPAQVRPFPVTVPAGGEIALWVTVTKPACPHNTFWIRTELPIRWSALGLHHVYRMPLEPEIGGNGDLPIAQCYPSAALKHVERG